MMIEHNIDYFEIQKSTLNANETITVLNIMLLII